MYVDVLVRDLLRRVMVMGIIAKQMPRSERLMDTLKHLKNADSELLLLSNLESSSASELIHACRNVAAILANVEDLLWATLHRQCEPTVQIQ